NEATHRLLYSCGFKFAERHSSRLLTGKLRGRAPTAKSAEGAQFLSARGAKPQAHHGPLQRLLDGMLARRYGVPRIAPSAFRIQTVRRPGKQDMRRLMHFCQAR